MGTQALHVVVGATGGAGAAVVRELLARGKRVRAVSRRASTFPAGVEVVAADIADREQAKRACDGAKVVYNCANAPYTEWTAKFPAIVAGSIAGASAAGAKLVFSDNVYMYGPLDGPIREDTPYRATGKKGKLRIRLAETLMEAHARGEVRVAIGRAADYYGPDVRVGIVNDAFVRRAMDGKRAIWFGRVDVPHTQTFIDDVSRGLVTLGERDEALGQVWHLPTAAPITVREFIELLFAEAGHRTRIARVPGLALRALAPFVPIVRELTEIAYQYEAPFVVDSTKFERAFGMRPTPYREALRRTIDWLRANPADGRPGAQATGRHGDKVTG